MQSEELQLPVAAALPGGYLGQDAKKVGSASCRRLQGRRGKTSTETHSDLRMRSSEELCLALTGPGWGSWGPGDSFLVFAFCL